MSVGFEIISWKVVKEKLNKVNKVNIENYQSVLLSAIMRRVKCFSRL